MLVHRHMYTSTCITHNHRWDNKEPRSQSTEGPAQLCYKKTLRDDVFCLNLVLGLCICVLSVIDSIKDLM